MDVILSVFLSMLMNKIFNYFPFTFGFFICFVVLPCICPQWSIKRHEQRFSNHVLVWRMVCWIPWLRGFPGWYVGLLDVMVEGCVCWNDVALHRVKVITLRFFTELLVQSRESTSAKVGILLVFTGGILMVVLNQNGEISFTLEIFLTYICLCIFLPPNLTAMILLS